MSATVLIAEAADVERILTEGGLRSSFCRMFRGTLVDTADPTPRGDGQGFDDLLRDCRVVCMDVELLRPLAFDAPNRVERERYRNNLQHKVASRQHIWLAVIAGGASEQRRQLDEFTKRMAECSVGFGPNAHRSIVVLIFTEPITDESQEVVKRLSGEPDVGSNSSIAKVYIMFDRLQLSQLRTTAIASHNVWPMCVARLLAHLGLNHVVTQGRCDGLYVWRTIVWGGADQGDWSSKYRAMLAEELMPSRDEKSNAERSAHSLKRTSPGDFREKGNPFDKDPRPDVRWAIDQDAEELQRRAFDYVHESVFLSVLEADGWHVKGRRPLQSSTGAVGGNQDLAAQRWGEVASAEDGLVALRRLKEGRGWRLSPLPEDHESQRAKWGAIIQKRRELNEAREQHRDASEEISIARRRHLSLLWRLIIAVAVILFIGQFLFSALSPLRPPPSEGELTALEKMKEGILGTEFWGLTKDGGETVYVVDCSGSMSEKIKLGTRFDGTKSKLKECVTGLPSTSRFLVVFFDHEMHHMVASKELQSATEGAKKRVLEEIDTWQTRGGTDPTDAIAYALAQFTPLTPPPPAVADGSVNTPAPTGRSASSTDPPPAQIVLLTDGIFAEPERVHETVARFNEARGPKERVKLNTVAIDCINAQDTLKKLATDSGGEFRHIHFEPFSIFDPLGFNLVMAIILGAGAIGVTLGAFLPWILEVWRGKRACDRLVPSLVGLRRDFGHVSRDTQTLMEGSSTVRLATAHNGVATAQRALAIRAHWLVESQLQDTHSATRGSGRASHGGDSALAVEDCKDLHESLDVCAIEAGVGPEFADELRQLVLNDAKVIRKAWGDLCEKYDRFSRGHLPSHAIETILCRTLERSLDKLLTDFMWKAAKPRKDNLDAKAAQLVRLLNDESSCPCLSGRVANPSKWPDRNSRVSFAVPEVADDSLAGWSRDLVTTVKHQLPKGIALSVAAEGVTNVGLIAFGFAHQELRVELASCDDYDVILHTDEVR